MFGVKRLFVLVLLQVFLILVHYSESESDLTEDPDSLIVPNQIFDTKRHSIYDCHIRFHKYAWLAKLYTAAAKGRLAFLREFAHMAAIGWSQRNGTINWNCGGSLIWENVILTAAHCAVDLYNKPPDVARFGDLNLIYDGDNEYAQQRKIVSITKHPEHTFRKKYHDIALMRLEKAVNLHDTVAPACLWIDDKIRFKSLEATGWGATSYVGGNSPALLKVSLRPVDANKCSRYYFKLRSLDAGLHANQMCAGDVEMDTCPGDSGGPLEVKLLHNTRITPFVVGVTSFGSSCGKSAPGIYTRVAPYLSWILSTLNKFGVNVTDTMFEPQVCAKRYIEYREFEPAVLLGKSSISEDLRFRYAHLFEAAREHKVSIHWDPVEALELRQCYGVVFQDKLVVTLAQCTAINGKPPTHIRYDGDKISEVAEYFRHPKYDENTLHNNIGILKLKHPVKFSEKFVPACLDFKEASHNEKLIISGRGSRTLIELDPVPAQTLTNNTVDVHATGSKYDITNCSAASAYTSHVGKRITDEHLCFGAELFLVPGTCNQSLGSPIYYKMASLHRYIHNVYALNLFGEDCGYGLPAVGVKISHHTKWIESVLLPKEAGKKQISPIVFLHSELKEGDHCKLCIGSHGMCVNTTNCPRMMHEFQIGGLVPFCQNGSLVCCPREFIRNETNPEWLEIDECENRPKTRQFGYLPIDNIVSLIWIAGTSRMNCTGTFITNRTIVVAASCVDGLSFPTVVVVDKRDNSILKSMAVERITVHPEFNNATKQHNIALIKTKDQLDASWRKVIACLWKNTTHTPFFLSHMLLNTTTTESSKYASFVINDNDEISFEEDSSEIEAFEEDSSEEEALDEGETEDESSEYSMDYTLRLASESIDYTTEDEMPFSSNKTKYKTAVRIMSGYVVYNTDCETAFGRKLKPNELCVSADDGHRFINAPALWKGLTDEKASTSYLVGIVSQISPNQHQSSSERLLLHTRISSYVSWIKSVL